MIQIHVENAVDHGIQHQAQGGCLKIVVTDKPEEVGIIIEDEGIGRKKAKQIGSVGTGNATKMLREIQEIFNEKNTNKISRHYEDDIFISPSGKPYGTRVVIIIPKQYNFDYDN